MTLMLLMLACSDGGAGPASSDSSAVPTSGSFSVLTYNVKGLPDAITGTDGADRMAKIAPLLPGFDVIGLQETFDASFHQALVAEADHPVRDWSDATLDSTRAYGNGLGLLVRDFEEVERSAFFYAECSGLLDGASDCLASKGLQRIRLAVPGTETFLDLYNTHHEAGGGEDDVAARASQVSEVVAAIEAQSGDAAVVFVGDMNLHHDDPDDAPLLERYEALGLRDSCAEVGCSEPFHIDRIWVRDGPDLQLDVSDWVREEAFVDEDGVDLSDHPALSAGISWTR